MSVFEKLISEFATMTGLEIAPDVNESCTLESNGVIITIQYRSDADDVVIFAPLAIPENGSYSRSAYEKALSLAYDGQGTGGAFLGLFDGALILSLHLPVEGLDAPTLGVRLTAFADAAESLNAEIAVVPEDVAEPARIDGLDFSCNQTSIRV